MVMAVVQQAAAFHRAVYDARLADEAVKQLAAATCRAADAARFAPENQAGTSRREATDVVIADAVAKQLAAATPRVEVAAFENVAATRSTRRTADATRFASENNQADTSRPEVADVEMAVAQQAGDAHSAAAASRHADADTSQQGQTDKFTPAKWHASIDQWGTWLN